MTYITNIAFTELIKVNGRLREFNFRKRSETIYDVDTSDEGGNRYIFRLVKDDDWHIESKELPQSIYDREEELNKIVDRAL